MYFRGLSGVRPLTPKWYEPLGVIPSYKVVDPLHTHNHVDLDLFR